MKNNQLRLLYQKHSGKVSDKWNSYFYVYEEIFNELADEPVNILEIGVQNGGSLEITAKYFKHAINIIGCDINPDCDTLNFKDPRIHLVVGDATDDGYKKITSICEDIDIVIDDGSHKSSDVAQSFALYFPLLKEGGTYVAEDLHCSYWAEYEGGLFDPTSSISFFKALADIVSYEHWGIPKKRKWLLASFSERYGLHIDEESLSKIHSVEFRNSVCIIRKLKISDNLLGDRVIAGLDAAVIPEILHKDKYAEVIDQSENCWSMLDRSPGDQWISLNQAIADSDKHIASLDQAVYDCEKQIASLNQIIFERDNKLKFLKADITKIYQSKSWRLTLPIRFISTIFKDVVGNTTYVTQTQQSVDERERENDSVPVDATSQSPKQQEVSDPSFDVLSGLGPNNHTQNISVDSSKLIAFYLPQYHRVAENSEWWGPGFTEWTNVVRGRPNYDGHYQPHLPRELGFYDLSNIEVIREQAELARLYGVGAFCFYYYWFSGRRLLDKPIDNFLASDIDMEYCLCWANENWTRTWDGDTRSVLMEQKYLDTDPQEFIESLLPHFHDPRYLRVKGKPMLIVYRAKDIPDTASVFEEWRRKVEAAGFSGLHITVVDFYDISRPEEVCADALIEFPPHKFNGPQTVPDTMPELTNEKFQGGIVDYTKVMAQSSNRPCPDYTLYRGVIPSWDNTARRQDSPTILHGSTPELFFKWLQYIRAYTRNAFAGREDPFIFINAWNEWGEGCHLEPDQKWGLSYLEAVKKSSWYSSEATLESARGDLVEAAVSAIHLREKGDNKKFSSVQDAKSTLGKIQPVQGRVQKIAFVLRKYPLIYRVGKFVYKGLKLVKIRV